MDCAGQFSKAGRWPGCIRGEKRKKETKEYRKVSFRRLKTRWTARRGTPTFQLVREVLYIRSSPAKKLKSSLNIPGHRERHRRRRNSVAEEGYPGERARGRWPAIATSPRRTGRQKNKINEGYPDEMDSSVGPLHEPLYHSLKIRLFFGADAIARDLPMAYGLQV